MTELPSRNNPKFSVITEPRIALPQGTLTFATNRHGFAELGTGSGIVASERPMPLDR